MVIVKQRKKEQKIIHKKIKPCKKLRGFFMCYTKIFQSCPFACRRLLLSKQRMHDISQGVEDCSFLVTSEGVKIFFQKDLEVSKKVVPLQR